MLSALIERIKSMIAGRSSAVSTGLTLIQKNWTQNQEMIKGFSPEFVKQQSEQMMEEIIKIAVSPNPRMANRVKLTECVCEMAQFQVLTITPPPSEDRTGLRGQVGITGELKMRLFDLYQADKGLREFFHGLEYTPETWDDVWNPVLIMYRQCHAWTHIFHSLRFVFDDVNKESGKDWFRPFVAAICGFKESLYRQSVGMQSAFDRTSEIDPGLKPRLLSMFMNCVLDGARYPDLEWNERLAEIERGDRAWRANSWLA
jgi:hypothetical protein